MITYKIIKMRSPTTIRWEIEDFQAELKMAKNAMKIFEQYNQKDTDNYIKWRDAAIAYKAKIEALEWAMEEEN